MRVAIPVLRPQTLSGGVVSMSMHAGSDGRRKRRPEATPAWATPAWATPARSLQTNGYAAEQSLRPNLQPVGSVLLVVASIAKPRGDVVRGRNQVRAKRVDELLEGDHRAVRREIYGCHHLT